MVPDVDDEQLRLDDQLCFAMYDAANAVTRAYRAGLAPLGLTYTQYLVLLVLWEVEPLTVTAIAKRLNLATHAVTPIISRMTARGLVCRTGRTVGDLRRVDVHLTESGRALHDQVRDVQRAIAAETGLTPPELAELRDQLRVVSLRLAQVDQVVRANRNLEESG